MRRPQGFEGQQRAGQGRAGQGRAGQQPASPQPAVPGAGPRRSGSPTTAPITLPSTDTAARQGARVTRLPLGLTAPRTTPGGASQGARATLSAGARLTGGAARAGLRAAKRARKRYERQEVRRFTWRSRRRRTNWVVALGAVAVMTLVVVGAGYSPLMALRTIEVVGASRVSADALVDALDEQVGTPLPLIDFDALNDQLAEFMLIQSYVTESRPPGTLVVRIVEREPVGALVSAGGSR
jgi:cell division protein FtsQ